MDLSEVLLSGGLNRASGFLSAGYSTDQTIQRLLQHYPTASLSTLAALVEIARNGESAAQAIRNASINDSIDQYTLPPVPTIPAGVNEVDIVISFQDNSSGKTNRRFVRLELAESELTLAILLAKVTQAIEEYRRQYEVDQPADAFHWTPVFAAKGTAS